MDDSSRFSEAWTHSCALSALRRAPIFRCPRDLVTMWSRAAAGHPGTSGPAYLSILRLLVSTISVLRRLHFGIQFSGSIDRTNRFGDILEPSLVAESKPAMFWP